MFNLNKNFANDHEHKKNQFIEVSKENDLAKSAQIGLKSLREKFQLIKDSIARSMITKRKEFMRPTSLTTFMQPRHVAF